jgi:3-isopropylmalate/(R)-2-methylmalate dehydratase large subunit
MAAPRTLFAKLWDDHLIAELGGDVALLLVDRVLLHERTGGIALQSLAEAGRDVLAPQQVFATMDHVVDTIPGRSDKTIMPTGTNFISATRAATKAAGITLFDLGDRRQGIVHVISPEQAIVLPGLTLVCPDSHTSSQGALGALAWGIGSTEAEHALATSTLRVRRPPTMRIALTGKMQHGVTAKDVALAIIARLGSAGARAHAVEYAGDAVRHLEIEGRLTLCNMAAELSAFTALIAPDETVFNYLRGRTYAPQGDAWDLALQSWRQLHTDEGATFDSEVVIDVGDVGPMVTWGTSPQQTISIHQRVPEFASVSHRETRDGYDRALAYMGLAAGSKLEGLPIDAAFIGSCTNSRLSDLRRAASLVRGQRVAPGVRAVVVPGSTRVKEDAEAEGLDRIFMDAGFEWRESGCSMCFFAGGEHFSAGARVITSTNRNFENRQGPGTRSHLASPEMVAASALAGSIADPRKYGA